MGAVATHRERLIRLPAATGDLATDVRAVKAALRGETIDDDTPVGLTLRLFGGEGFGGCRAGVRALPRVRPGTPHLELTLVDDVLSADLHGADLDAPAATVAREIGPSLGALAGLASAPAPAAWTESDFPLAPLAPGAVAALAARHPDVETALAATPGQTGMIFHAITEPESAVYAIHTTLRLRPGFDVARLQAALDGLVARHGVLRSRFDWTLATARSRSSSGGPGLPLAVVDGRAGTAADHRALRTATLAADRARPIPSTQRGHARDAAAGARWRRRPRPRRPTTRWSTAGRCRSCSPISSPSMTRPPLCRRRHP